MTDQKESREHLFCPCCEEEITEASFPYCQACGVTIFYCPNCREPVSRDKKVCPQCGTEIKVEKS